MNKQKSIRSRLKYIFICVALIMSIGFYLSFSMKDTIIKEYDQSMHTNIMLSNLSIELNKCINAFDKYLKNRDVEYYQEYAVAKQNIEGILKNIESDIKEDKKSSIFLRNLENMFHYHVRLANEILIQDGLDISTYKKMIELKTLFGYMNSHSQMMTTSYLDYSSSQYSKLLEQYKSIENNIYMVLIFFSVISLVFAVALSNDILDTIDDLYKSAELLSNANWEVPDIKENSYRELNSLAHAFNNMKKNIKAFIEELNKKAELEINLNKARLKNIEQDKLLKESQLRTLQMQMDPHFLFNTLNTVSRTAMFEGAQSSVKLIEAVSKILRYNLTNMGKMVKLEEEVSVLKAYTIIQETRFQDQMAFKFEMENDLGEILIPPMTIQPIVENAIIHGLSDKEKDGKIHIAIARNKNHIEIKVSDNGKGIEKENLSKLFDEKGDQKKKGHTTGLGLSNVKKRLELYFNEKDLITIESEKKKGTTVSILIPLKGDEQIVEAYDC